MGSNCGTHIRGIHDGVIRKNIPEVKFNNSNWPYMVKVGHIWVCLSMALFPLIAAGLNLWVPTVWIAIERYVFLIMMLSWMNL